MPTVWPPFGVEIPDPQPRCGHCGRFLARGWEAFDQHIEAACPVGGYFTGDGRLRRDGVTLRERAA